METTGEESYAPAMIVVPVSHTEITFYFEEGIDGAFLLLFGSINDFRCWENLKN